MRKLLTFLKTLIAAVAVIVLFTACKQLLDDPEDFLSYWAGEAFIKDRSIGSAHRPDGAGVPCVGSSDNVLITLTAHNPKNFPFVMPSSSEPAGIVEFKELSHQPAAGADYELKQTGSGTLELTYKQDFLKRYEQGSAALNPTITLKAKDGRVFKQTFTFGIKSNTPPPKPKEIVLAKTKITGTETKSYYVLCFQFDSVEMTKKVTIGSGTVPIHKDIAKITINDSPYTLLYKEDNSDFQKPAETFSIGSFIESGNVEILDSSSPDVPSGWVLYFKTGIQVQSTNPQTSYTITLSDNKGVVSDVFTAELKKKFKVTFNSQDGSPVPAQYIKNNGKVTRPTDPTKTGYIFGGWYKNAACSDGQEWNFANEIVTGDITLYAKWTAGSGTQYNVEHYQQNIDDDNYTIVGSDTQTSYGTTGASAAYTPKTYEGFTYESHLTTINGTVQPSGNIAGNGSTVVKLYYKRNEITVTFNLNGGKIGTDSTSPVERKGKYDAPLTAPTVEKKGYNFSGWQPMPPAQPLTSTFPAANATYTALWTEAGDTSYKIEYWHQNIGDNDYTRFDADTISSTGKTNATITVVHNTYPGFTYEKQEPASPTIAADGDTVVKVYYTRNMISVTFKLNGGNISGNTSDVTSTGKYGATLTKPADPTKPGYTFNSWQPDGDAPALPSTFPEKNAEYTAQWTANTYKVQFQGNGEDSGSMSDQTFTYGQSQQLSANGFTKTGYTFAGWATSPTGNKVYDNQQSVSNLTPNANATVVLYAVWEIDKYTVTYFVAFVDGDVGGTLTAKVDDSPIQSGNEVEHGKEVTFTAVPNAGWKVAEWKKDDVAVNGTNGTYTMSVTAGTTVTVKFYQSEIDDTAPTAWSTLLKVVRNAPANATIEINGEINATSDSGNNGEIVINKNLTIKGKKTDGSDTLNAITLSRIFKVETGNTLTLENITLTGGKASGTEEAANGGGILVKEGGKAELKNCTVKACEAAANGGGIYSLGEVTLDASTIGGSSASDGNKAKRGGGISLEKGTIDVSAGSFIWHNQTAGSSGMEAGGGGIFIRYGKLTLRGTVADNTALNGTAFVLGGGVYVGAQGEFIMETGATISGNTSKFGGGVYIDVVPAGAGTFTMKGGTISGCKAGGSGFSDAQGGGVYIEVEGTKQGTFSMEGGSITDCTAEATNAGGGGIYADNGAVFKMSGGAVITPSTQTNTSTVKYNDVYLEGTASDNAKITVNGTLTGTAPVARITVGDNNYTYSTQVLDGAITTGSPENYTKFTVTSKVLDDGIAEIWKIRANGHLEKSKYMDVRYDKLAYYLSSAYASSHAVEGINYIKITGTIPADDLRDYIYPSSGGRLAKTIQYAHKKVALKLPDSIPELTTMYNCFTKCEYLVSLEKIPSGVTSMESCFKGCTALTKAPDIPSSVGTMEHCFDGCTALTQAPTIHPGVTNMKWCFQDCKALISAPVIPQGVTDIYSCFQGCTRLTQVPNIPSSVTGMGQCFKYCAALTRCPDIPSTVGNMYQCFQGCTRLEELKLMCNYDGQFSLFKEVFDGCSNLNNGGIQVPQNQLQAYQDGAGNMGTTAAKFSGF